MKRLIWIISLTANILLISCRDNPEDVKLKFENNKSEIEKFCEDFWLDSNVYCIQKSEKSDAINGWGRNYWTRGGLKLGEKWMIGRKKVKDTESVLQEENISRQKYDSCLSFLKRTGFSSISKNQTLSKKMAREYHLTMVDLKSIKLEDDSRFFLLFIKDKKELERQGDYYILLDSLTSNIFLFERRPQPL